RVRPGAGAQPARRGEDPPFDGMDGEDVSGDAFEELRADRTALPIRVDDSGRIFPERLLFG
ncbi:hypothetical protein, partial [Microbacterium sp. gxy059]|uniref:hypothetical protein n=1 Tax=Microbacterium sp. gxy059 TaxID=2957199 RepID=UPI003D98C13D